MYKLILVDDELEIRHGLMEVIPFNALGFTIAGQASNGLEALSILESVRPDLVITDIRMPMMDGLAFIKKVRELYSTVHFMILTGYDDYIYTKQAIEMNTLSYLLKPITADEFCEVLKETKIKLDKSFAERNDVAKLREHFNLSLPILREAFLSAVFSGAVKGDQARETAKSYHLGFEAGAYLPALCRIGNRMAESRLTDHELISVSVLGIMRDVLSLRYTSHLFHYDGMLAILLLLPDHDMPPDIPELFREARETAVYYVQCEINIGIGTAAERPEDLPAAVSRALTALEQSVITPDSEVVSAGDISFGPAADIIGNEANLKQLSNYIRLGDRERALGLLRDMLSVCRAAIPGVKAYQAFLMEILLAFVRVVPEMTSVRTDFSDDFSRFSRMVFTNCPTFDEAEAHLSAILTKVSDAMTAVRKTASLLISREAEEYMAAHYQEDDLSIDKLCRHLHVSPSYFSSVFKKEKRITFHQYLTELRMNEALKLLGETESKTAEVARLVGIPDPSYFSYCFKKHFGYPPSAIRRQRMS